MAHSTKELFPAFQDEVCKWIDRFGLRGWQADILLCADADNPSLEGARGACEAEILSRYAEIVLNAEWGREPSDKDIRRCAFHECCELLLMRMRHLAGNPRTRDDELEEEIHNLIRTLENAVFESAYEQR